MRIGSVRARRFAWPLDGRGAARGRRDREAIVIEVRGADGEVGLGEAAPLPEMADDSLAAAADALARLTAEVPFVIDRATDAFALALRVAPGSASARFAIEAGLCDALARAAGTSLASVLRPSPAARVALSAVVETVDEARAALAAGVHTLKLKLGPDEPLARVRAIAATGAQIRIDANRTWPLDQVADRIAALVEIIGDALAYVEEPCHDAHRLLDHPLACKLALDESLAALVGDTLAHVEEADRDAHLALDEGRIAIDAQHANLAVIASAPPPAALAALLRSPRLAALVLKPTLLGLGGTLAFAALAHDHGLAAVVSHGLEGPIGTAACAELALAIADPAPAGLAAHPGLTGWRLAVPELAADHVHAVAAPGLAGVALDLAAVIAAAPEPA